MNRADLVTENIKLVYYVINKMKLRNETDDYYDLGMIALCRAANTYNENVGVNFSTYACRVIEREFLHHINGKKCLNRKANENTISLSMVLCDDMILEDVIPDDFNVEEDIIEKEKIDILYECVYMLPPIERFVIIHYYGLNNIEKMTQLELAKIFNTTPTTIQNKIKKGLKLLKMMMNKFYR